MPINTIEVNLINNNLIKEKSKISEPYFVFKATEFNNEIFIEKKEIANDYEGTSVIFIFDDDKSKMNFKVKDKNNNILPFTKALSEPDPKPSEYLLNYNRRTQKTTLTLTFDLKETIINFESLSVYEVSILNNYENEVVLLKTNYQKEINSLAITKENKDDLLISLSDFFNENGLEYIKLFLFQNFEALKNKQNEISNYVIILLNIYSTNLSAFFDDKFYYFINFNNESKAELNDLKTFYPQIVMFENRDNLISKFTSVYFSELDNFYATNPYGISLKINPLLDATVITDYRNNNINFYSLLNETKKDGITAFKEAKFIDGRSIDEALVLKYIQNEISSKLYEIWNKNNRSNSKLNSLELDGSKPSEYTQSLEIFLDSIGINKGNLINSYNLSKIEIKKSNELLIFIELEIVYNASVNLIKFSVINNPYEGV